jgi:type I restriction enzyme S subunit
MTGRPSFTNQQINSVVVNENEHDPFFVYHLMTTLRDELKSNAGGAATPIINKTAFSEIEVSVPPLPVQRRIAGILSAYDELMENSQRRIRLLEAMARALYREWFVHFRFPGHEKSSSPAGRGGGEGRARLVTSPLGDIPQGWEVKRIGDTFQTVLGGTPSRAKREFWDGGTIPWINSGKVNDLRITEASELITPLALEKSAAKVMPKGTTVLAITGATLGQVSYLEIETTANQSVVGIVDPSGLWSEWIYLTIHERIEGIIKHASGGAQQHINKEIVNDVQVALPPDSLARDFKRFVAPMFRELAMLLFQIQNLRRTRDLLLPRLLSGQVELKTQAA